MVCFAASLQKAASFMTVTFYKHQYDAVLDTLYHRKNVCQLVTFVFILGFIAQVVYFYMVPVLPEGLRVFGGWYLLVLLGVLITWVSVDAWCTEKINDLQNAYWFIEMEEDAEWERVFSSLSPKTLDWLLRQPSMKGASE